MKTFSSAASWSKFQNSNSNLHFNSPISPRAWGLQHNTANSLHFDWSNIQNKIGNSISILITSYKLHSRLAPDFLEYLSRNGNDWRPEKKLGQRQRYFPSDWSCFSVIMWEQEDITPSEWLPGGDWSVSTGSLFTTRSWLNIMPRI